MDVYVILVWCGYDPDGVPYWMEWARVQGRQVADDLARSTNCEGPGKAYVIAPLLYLLGNDDALPDDEKEELTRKMKKPLGGD